MNKQCEKQNDRMTKRGLVQVFALCLLFIHQASVDSARKQEGEQSNCVHLFHFGEGFSQTDMGAPLASIIRLDASEQKQMMQRSKVHVSSLC